MSDQKGKITLPSGKNFTSRKIIYKGIKADMFTCTRSCKGAAQIVS